MIQAASIGEECMTDRGAPQGCQGMSSLGSESQSVVSIALAIQILQEFDYIVSGSVRR